MPNPIFCGRALVRLGSAVAFLLLLISCASGPPPPAPGTSTVYGQIQMIPRGDAATKPSSATYANPALRDVRFFDYDRVDFAVVYADQTGPDSDSRLVLRNTPVRLRLEPENSAMTLGGSLIVTNETPERHVFSDPAAGWVRELAAGESARLTPPVAGAHSIFVLDAPELKSRVFVAPGRHALVSGRGRFELKGLSPGATKVHVWHPRLPPTERIIRLEPDVRHRLDVAIGVGVDIDQGEDP